MTRVIEFDAGGYRYIEGVFQYSAGVAAMPGYTIERVRLKTPVPLARGFDLIEQHLDRIGRPFQAFCACELRSPEPFSEEGFVTFNRLYVTTLERWGIYRDGINPVARTNVCPEYGKPEGPSLYAFSYTVPDEGERPGFIIAGGGEASEGDGPYRDRIVRLGDTSPEGLAAKVRFVIDAMQGRLNALGYDWPDAVLPQAYSAFDFGRTVLEDYAQAGIIPGGLLWHVARPPVENIDFEMDVIGATRMIQWD